MESPSLKPVQIAFASNVVIALFNDGSMYSLILGMNTWTKLPAVNKDVFDVPKKVVDPTKFVEPSEEEIQLYLQVNSLPKENWWHAREKLRIIKNGPPPNGFSDWGIYFHCL